ncbi:MAG: PAS domain S-box protein [Ferruginibacter sp.]
MPKFSIRAIILSAFAVALLVVGFFVWAAFQNMQTVIEESRKINTCSQAQQMIDKIHADLEGSELAYDNFFYSPNDSSFLFYKITAGRLLSDTGLLTKITAEDNPGEAETEQLRNIILEKAAIAKTIDEAYNAGNDSALAALKKNINQTAGLEAGRKLLDDVETKNRAVVIQSGKFQEKIAEDTSRQFLIMAAIFFFFLLALFFTINSSLDKQQKTTEQLGYQASLINLIPDAIIATDSKLKITGWNNYAEDMYGYSQNEVLGKTIGEVLKLNIDPQEYKSSLSELKQKGNYRGEYTATTKNESLVSILASVSALQNSHAEVTGYVAVHRDISDRKRAEKKLLDFNTELETQVKEKTTEISSILQRITDGFLALNSDLTFTFVNKQAGEILGHLPSQMIGKNIFTGFPETASHTFNEACYNALKNQQYCFVENYYAPLNIWIENDIYPSADGLTVFFKDITFKKNAELALKESEEHYRHLIENMHAGVVVHDPSTAIILVNQEASRLLGLSAGTLMGKTIVDPDWHFIAADGKKIEQEDYPVELVIKSKEPLYNLILGIESEQHSNRVWVLVNAFPEFDMESNLKQVVVTFVDITDRKKAEEELKYREDVLNKAQSIAKIGSWELDLQTKKFIWSKEHYRIFDLEGYEGEDLYHQYKKKLYPHEFLKIEALMSRAAATGEGFTLHHHIICNDSSEKNILCIGETIKDTDNKVITLKGTVQDISEMKKTEERLQKSYEQIRQLAAHLQNIREEERTNMAREIHDELGQQLTGLNMYISWLNKKVQPHDPEIKEKFTNALELIEDTVKLVRKISTKLRPSMLDDLGLIAAIEWQSNEFEKRSGIKTEFVNLTGNLPIPGTVATGLFRIFQESLTNVARHAEASKIIASLERKDGNLVLTIADNGKGFVLNEIGSKKTLGLFGMKERSMVMGGQYEIKTAPGEGTTVCITVPFNSSMIKEKL